MSTVAVQDAGGSEAFVAYIFADNSIELYATDKPLHTDSLVEPIRPAKAVIHVPEKPVSQAAGTDEPRRLAFTPT